MAEQESLGGKSYAQNKCKISEDLGENFAVELCVGVIFGCVTSPRRWGGGGEKEEEREEEECERVGRKSAGRRKERKSLRESIIGLLDF